LTLAFDEAYRHGMKPVPVEIAQSMLSRRIDDLKPALTRHGYDVSTLAEQSNAEPVKSGGSWPAP
jgi:hypothetical protein